MEGFSAKLQFLRKRLSKVDSLRRFQPFKLLLYEENIAVLCSLGDIVRVSIIPSRFYYNHLPNARERFSEVAFTSVRRGQ